MLVNSGVKPFQAVFACEGDLRSQSDDKVDEELAKVHAYADAP